MDFAYTYGDGSSLYLNVTNRCTNRCSFCVRNHCRGLGSGLLTGGEEPDLSRLLAAIEPLKGPAREAVWCGFGEPTFRLDLILAAAPALREMGLTIRLNTNGQGNLIQGRDILPELGRAVDRVSVSLNAPNRERYLALCRPDPSALPGWQPGMEPPPFWEALLDFLGRAPAHLEWVQASVVGQALTEEEIGACRELAAGLGCPAFRVR